MRNTSDPGHDVEKIVKQLNSILTRNSTLARRIEVFTDGSRLQRLINWDQEEEPHRFYTIFARRPKPAERIAQDTKDREALIRALERVVDRAERTLSRLRSTGDMVEVSAAPILDLQALPER